MHNLHLQSFCLKGVIIDASTQDTSPFCLLCLHITFSWITWLLVYLLGLLGKHYGLHGCAATPADLSCFPACFSCLIDFYNHLNCCINISWRLLFRDKSSRHVFFKKIGIILVLSRYMSKPMFNKGLWALNFFYFKSEWKLAFWCLVDLHLGCNPLENELSFKYELAPFEHREFSPLESLAFSLSVVLPSWQFTATIAAEKVFVNFYMHAVIASFLVCESHYISACVFTQSCFHHPSKLLSLKTFSFYFFILLHF